MKQTVLRSHSVASSKTTAVPYFPQGTLEARHPSERNCRRSVVVKARGVDISRRQWSVGMLSAALLLSERPAEALFGIGDSSKSYETETGDLLTTVKNVVSLPRDDPQRESDVSRVRSMTNAWVARYRRDNNFAGRPSFSNTYSVVNALAGHFNSFGTETPFPKKRLDQLLKEVDDAERFLSRGR